MSQESLQKAAEAAGYAMATDEALSPPAVLVNAPGSPKDVLRRSLVRQETDGTGKASGVSASLWERASLAQLLPTWAVKT